MNDRHRALTKQISRHAALAEEQASKRQAAYATHREEQVEKNEAFRQWMRSWSMRLHQQEKQSE